MMKTISLIFLMFALSKGCGADQQQQIKNTEVEYTANARGFYLRIVVKDQHYSVYRNRRDEQQAAVKDERMSDAQWKSLVAAFQKLNLQELPSYVGPTKKRFYDGAPNANLKVTSPEQVYESQTFDHGAPPAQIEKLINLLNALVPQS